MRFFAIINFDDQIFDEKRIKRSKKEKNLFLPAVYLHFSRVNKGYYTFFYM